MEEFKATMLELVRVQFEQQLRNKEKQLEQQRRNK